MAALPAHATPDGSKCPKDCGKQRITGNICNLPVKGIVCGFVLPPVANPASILRKLGEALDIRRPRRQRGCRRQSGLDYKPRLHEIERRRHVIEQKRGNELAFRAGANKGTPALMPPDDALSLQDVQRPTQGLTAAAQSQREKALGIDPLLRLESALIEIPPECQNGLIHSHPALVRHIVSYLRKRKSRPICRPLSDGCNGLLIGSAMTLATTTLPEAIHSMKLRLDPFLGLMLAAVVVATFLPATGAFAGIIDGAGTFAVSLLFFLHGAALSPRSVLDGLKQWQLHLFIFATTFILFPLAVQPLGLLPESVLPGNLRLGFIYLAVLPSAVSSSIAFTAMAKGNVPAAACNSAGSNVFGLLLTPLLMTLFLSTSSPIDLGSAFKDIVVHLLLPFALGQALHRYAGGMLSRHKQRLEQYDQSVIVLIIYSAFSHSVTAGLWEELPVGSILVAAALCTALLLAVFAFTIYGTRRLGFSRGDEIAAVFCGSKKSLATGLPLAQVLFAGSAGFGMIVLPIMLYNQIQIIIGAMLARRYATDQLTRA